MLCAGMPRPRAVTYYRKTVKGDQDITTTESTILILAI